MSVTSRTHYEVLGVAPDATEQEVKAAYRKLAKSLHPDMATGSDALFGLVCEAYEVLSKPDRRAAYDRDLSGPTTGTAQQSPPSPPTSNGPGTGGGARGPHTDRGTQGPFSRAYTAAAAGRPYSSPWSSTFRRAAAGPVRAGSGSLAAPGRGHSIAWWAVPLVLAVLFGFGLLRFTGLTAAVVGVEYGDPLILGTRWRGVPDLDGEAPLSLAKAALLVAGLGVALTAGFWWRKQQAPTPRTEKVLLLVALGALAGFGEFLLVSGRAWLILLVLVAGYAGWVWTLTRLPRPGSTAQWESFPLWIAAVREHQARVRRAAKLARRQRIADLRAGVRRTFHGK